MDLIPYIGSWGRYQTFIYLLICPIFALFGITIMAITFTGAIPESRCFIDGLDNETAPQFHNPIVKENLSSIYAPPMIQRGAPQRCSICRGDEMSDGSNLTCTKGRAIKCPNSRYIYDRSQYTNSLSMEFGMICEEGAWKRELASSMYMVGATIGAYVGGHLGDRFGRRPILLIGQYGGVACMLLLLAAPNFIVLCVLQVLLASLIFSAYISGYVIVMEITGGTARTVAGIGAAVVWLVGSTYVGGMAYFIRDWQYLQLSFAMFGLLTLPSFWFVPESVRWLLAHGRVAEAERRIVAAASMNRVTISVPMLADELLLNAGGGKSEKVENTNNNDGFKNLLSHKSLLKMCLITFYIWFADALTSFGISLNTTDLPGDTYFNYALSNVMEIPAHIVCILLAERLGRRPTTAFLLGLAGASIFACQFLPAEGISWLIIILACIGRAGSASSFALMYAYTAEMFPTGMRNAGMGIAGASARVGTILAPQVGLLSLYVAPWLPFTIYGLSAFLGAFLSLFLPETLGAPMPQTIDDAVKMASRKTQFCGRPKAEGNFERLEAAADDVLEKIVL